MTNGPTNKNYDQWSTCVGQQTTIMTDGPTKQQTRRSHNNDNNGTIITTIATIMTDGPATTAMEQ